MTDIVICVVGLIISHGIVFFAGLVEGMKRGSAPAVEVLPDQTKLQPHHIRVWDDYGNGCTTAGAPGKSWDQVLDWIVDRMPADPLHIETNAIGEVIADMLEARGRKVVRRRPMPTMPPPREVKGVF